MSPSSYLKVLQNAKYSTSLESTYRGGTRGGEQCVCAPALFYAKLRPAEPRTQFFLREGLRLDFRERLYYYF